MLVNGKWSKDFEPVQEKDEKGGFVRKDSAFRDRLGDADFPVEPGRYHLFVAYICPWACRTLMLRALKHIPDTVLSISVVEPALTDQGWHFGDYPGATGPDTIIGAQYLHELYSHADPQYTGRATVPLLWDKKQGRAVNNESSEIVKMLNIAFNDFIPDAAAKALDLYPADLAADIDAFNAAIYPSINNGVYRTGFATTQAAYDEAYTALFAALDDMDRRFADGRKFAMGDALTLADIHLFPTLIRFDAAYYGLFKANKKRMIDYPNLRQYMARMMDIPAIAATVNFDHIKAGYYSIKQLNPLQIIPAGPATYY